MALLPGLGELPKYAFYTGPRLASLALCSDLELKVLRTTSPGHVLPRLFKQTQSTLLVVVST
jgi:hypothetical protein